MSNVFLLVEYPTCSTCKKAAKWLNAAGVAYSKRHIVEQSPSADELRSWAATCDIPVKRLFNTSGKLYRELGIKDRLASGMSDDEAFELLGSNGMLVKRPILVGDGVVLVGFKEDAWKEALA